MGSAIDNFGLLLQSTLLILTPHLRYRVDSDERLLERRVPRAQAGDGERRLHRDVLEVRAEQPRERAEILRDQAEIRRRSGGDQAEIGRTPVCLRSSRSFVNNEAHTFARSASSTLASCESRSPADVSAVAALASRLVVD